MGSSHRGGGDLVVGPGRIAVHRRSARLEPTELRSVEDTTYVTEFDITYNPDDDEYLAVWRRVGNSGIGDIAGVTLDAAGTPMGSPVVVASATTLGEAFRDAGRWDPDVEYNPVTKEYLLVLLRDTGLVSGQRIDTTGRPVGSEIELTTLVEPSNEQCAVEGPDIVADPSTGGWVLAYQRTYGTNIGGCGDTLEPYESIAMVQTISEEFVGGPPIYVGPVSRYGAYPSIDRHPTTGTFMVTNSTSPDIYGPPLGHAQIFTSNLTPVTGSIDLVNDLGAGADGGSYVVPVADPATGNWLAMWNAPGNERVQMNVVGATGDFLGSHPVPFRGTTSKLSSVGDGTILMSTGRGPLQHLRQDGSEIHSSTFFNSGNFGVNNVVVANGRAESASAVGVGEAPGTLTVASAGVAIYDSGPLPLPPARLLDTRTGPDATTIDGLNLGAGRISAGETAVLKVTGRGGVPDDADAVLVNVAAAGASAGGFVTVYPCDATTRPITSNLNYPAGGAASAAAIAKVAADGTVCLYTSSDTHVIVDVNGFVPDGGSVEPLVPARLLETRIGLETGTIDQQSEGIGRVGSGSTTTLTVAGRGGIDTDADAVLVNVTAIRPTTGVYLTVYPCDAERPTAASLNAPANGVVNNLVTAKTSASGTICIFSSAETDLVVDVAAFVPRDGGLLTIVPARLYETRPGETTVDGESQGVGRIQADSTVQVRLNRGAVPAGATGVMLNVAAINPTTAGYMTLFPYPCDDANRPTAANVNFRAGAVVSNAVFVKAADITEGAFACVYSSSEADLAIDIVGYTVDT